MSDPEAAPAPPSVAAPPRSLKSLAIRGAAWTVAGYGASQVLRLGSNLILTRLLFPEAFGLMALVHVVLSGLQMFSDVGIGPSIIQNQRGEDPRFLNTAWTIQVFRGFALWIACSILAWPVALFYAEPQLLNLLPVAGLTAVIAGFNSPALALANRKLALGRLTVLELGTQIITLAVMIAWALAWPSVWALLAGTLLGTILKMAGSHVWLGGVRCRLDWDKEAFSALRSFGKWIFVSTVLTFLVGQGDRLAFGKLLTIGELGIYSIAVMLAAVPRQVLVTIQGKVVFPAYCRLVHEGRLTHTTFHRVRRPLAVIGAALGSLLIASGPLLIPALYDARYHSAGWMLQVLACGAIFWALESLNSSLMLARGRSDAMAAGSAVKLVGMVVLLPLGWILAGLSGAILGLVASELMRYLTSCYFVERAGLRVIGRDALLSLWVGLTAVLGWSAGLGVVSHMNWHISLGVLVSLAVPVVLWSTQLVGVVASLKGGAAVGRDAIPAATANTSLRGHD
jgi:O-antigen/teichoic acid export membrane protein